MPKKMQFERKLARKARQAPSPGSSSQDLGGPLTPGGASPLPVSPPSPAASADLAAGGEPIVRGNSASQRMSPPGHAQAQDVGAALAAQGGPTAIVPSSSVRAQETAQDVAAQNPGAHMLPPRPGLESHNLGQAEGAPKTPDMKRILADLIRNGPDIRIPGQGALSGKPAETWNEWRVRGLSDARSLQQMQAQNPTGIMVVPTSTSVVKLIEAWTANGCPDDLSVSPETYLSETVDGPGKMFAWGSDQNGKWSLTPFDPHKDRLVPGPIYFLLHGATPSHTNPDPLPAQKARAQIAKHVMGRDWKSAQGAVKHAAGMGMPEEELSSAVDEALPDANGARSLRNHDLLAAASAASPNKLKELMPAVQERFGDLSSVSPQAASAISSHLGRIGALPGRAQRSA